MITVSLEKTSCNDRYYVIRKDNDLIKLFYWKWCAIRFAKKLAKTKPINKVVFTIN